MSKYRTNKKKEPEINEFRTSSMEVWHTGVDYSKIKHTEMDSNNNTTHSMESLIRQYNRVNEMNAAMFAQAVIAISQGKCEVNDRFEVLSNPQPLEAKSYREHRAFKSGFRDADSSFSGSGARGGGWGDTEVVERKPWQDRRDNSNSRGGRPPREPKEGDWPCPKCNANNFAGRRECFRCKVPKDGGGDSGSFDSYSNRNNNKRQSNGWDDDDESSSKKQKVDESKPNVTGGENWDDEDVKVSKPSDEKPKNVVSSDLGELWD